MTIALEEVRVASRLVTATVRYEAADRTWRHPFDARILDDAKLDGALADAGLRRSRILDERGTWIEARLYSTP